MKTTGLILMMPLMVTATYVILLFLLGKTNDEAWREERWGALLMIAIFIDMFFIGLYLLLK